MPIPTKEKTIQAGAFQYAKNAPPTATTAKRNVPASTGPLAFPAPNDEK
jgi:hypothetical protein